MMESIRVFILLSVLVFALGANVVRREAMEAPDDVIDGLIDRGNPSEKRRLYDILKRLIKDSADEECDKYGECVAEKDQMDGYEMCLGSRIAEYESDERCRKIFEDKVADLKKCKEMTGECDKIKLSVSFPANEIYECKLRKLSQMASESDEVCEAYMGTNFAEQQKCKDRLQSCSPSAETPDEKSLTKMIACFQNAQSADECSLMKVVIMVSINTVKKLLIQVLGCDKLKECVAEKDQMDGYEMCLGSCRAEYQNSKQCLKVVEEMIAHLDKCKQQVHACEQNFLEGNFAAMGVYACKLEQLRRIALEQDVVCEAYIGTNYVQQEGCQKRMKTCSEGLDPWDEKSIKRFTECLKNILSMDACSLAKDVLQVAIGEWEKKHGAESTKPPKESPKKAREITDLQKEELRELLLKLLEES